MVMSGSVGRELFYVLGMLVGFLRGRGGLISGKYGCWIEK